MFSTKCSCAEAASWFDNPHQKVVPRSRIPRSTSHLSYFEASAVDRSRPDSRAQSWIDTEKISMAPAHGWHTRTHEPKVLDVNKLCSLFWTNNMAVERNHDLLLDIGMLTIVFVFNWCLYSLFYHYHYWYISLRHESESFSGFSLRFSPRFSAIHSVGPLWNASPMEWAPSTPTQSI